MISLTDISRDEIYHVRSIDYKKPIPSGLNRWYRSDPDKTHYWSIYYKGAEQAEFLIEHTTISINFYVGHKLAALLGIPTKYFIEYLATLIWPVTKEQFISIMIESNHCCLDWLLFNQDVWSK